MIVDTHAHLTMPEFAPDLPAVLERAAAAGVSTIVCVGFDLGSSREAVELARRYPQVVATVGIHPNDCAGLGPGWVAELRALATDPRVVAIGEIGLDYYRQRTERVQQQEVLRSQLELAGELDLPVSIHNRESDDDLGEILVEWASGLPPQHPRGVLHCFSGDLALMNRCGALGFYLSFGGPITYRNARRAAEIVPKVPEERLLLETDSPYLAPHPYRGKRNEPALVTLVAEKMAELRGDSLDHIVEITGQNATKLFRLEVPPA